jgi:hypothetical protein
MQADVYTTQCASDDEETQKFGIVLVVFLHKMESHTSHDIHLEDLQWMKRMNECSPVRRSGSHVCLPDTPACYAIRSSLLLLITKEQRTQTRVHVGSIAECYYSLKSFGVPTKCFPTNLNLSAKDYTKQRSDWVDLRRKLETNVLEPRWKTPGSFGSNVDSSYSFVNDIILCPMQEDVLFGKGKPIMRHAGNVTMRNLVELWWGEYEVADYSHKPNIAWRILFHVQRFGGRFLKEHPDGWFMEVEDDDARRKISIALRDRVKKSNKKQTAKDEIIVEKKKPLAPTPSSAAAMESSSTASRAAVGASTSVQPNVASMPVPESKNEDDKVEFLDLSFGSGTSKRRRHSHDGDDGCGPSSWFCGR